MRNVSISILPDGFVIEDAPLPIPNKISHLCPWHDDQNPSAVTFFKQHTGRENKYRSTTWCSACQKSMPGEAVVRGSCVQVTYRRKGSLQIWREDKDKKRESHPPTSVSQQQKRLSSLAEQSEEALARRILIAAAWELRELPAGELTDFWQAYLVAKGVDLQRMGQVSNPPRLTPIGIYFPTNIFALRELRPSLGGVMRTVGMKSINLFRSKGCDSEGHHIYTPCPERIHPRETIVVVESPVTAVRVHYLTGLPTIAALGMNRNLCDKLRAWGFRISVITDSLTDYSYALDCDTFPDDQLTRILSQMLRGR